MKFAQLMQTPLGDITLIETDGAMSSLRFGNSISLDAYVRRTSLLSEAKAELEAYFNGTLQTFSVPLEPSGTVFQQKVWNELQKIPYGETVSYGEIAKRIGNPKASRAVGMANNRNPLPILIPCHRVIGANGRMIGYGGGLHIKEYLVALEQKR